MVPRDDLHGHASRRGSITPLVVGLVCTLRTTPCTHHPAATPLADGARRRAIRGVVGHYDDGMLPDARLTRTARCARPHASGTARRRRRAVGQVVVVRRADIAGTWHRRCPSRRRVLGESYGRDIDGDGVVGECVGRYLDEGAARVTSAESAATPRVLCSQRGRVSVHHCKDSGQHVPRKPGASFGDVHCVARCGAYRSRYAERRPNGAEQSANHTSETRLTSIHDRAQDTGTQEEGKVGRALPPAALPRPSYTIARAHPLDRTPRGQQQPETKKKHARRCQRIASRAGGRRSHECPLPSRADVT